MSRNYKNILKLRSKAYGNIQRENITKETIANSTPIPQPLEYEDIDKEFKRWVEEELYVSYEGDRLPTYMLFSNQRFSEFLQSWDRVDEKKNLILNFKTITRENNPKTGTLLGNTKNIPGEHLMFLKRVEAFDKTNRRYFIDYKVKQPFVIDLIYTVGLITNKYELLNEFNILVNSKFKSINAYIKPNGHLIPMILNDISDESEYNIDNRTYYSQSYSILVKAYIMPKDSFIVEEVPDMKFVGYDGEERKASYAEIEELPAHMMNEREYTYAPIKIRIHLDKCATGYRFIIDTCFKVEKIEITNLRSFKLTVNDEEVILDNNFTVKENDEIKINKIIKYKNFEDAEIILTGFDYRNASKT